MGFLDFLFPSRRENKWKSIAEGLPEEMAESIDDDHRAEIEVQNIERTAMQLMLEEDKIIRNLGTLQAKKYTLVKAAMLKNKVIAKAGNAALKLTKKLTVGAIRMGQLAHVNTIGAGNKIKMAGVRRLINMLGVSLRETREGQDIKQTLDEGVKIASEKDRNELRKLAREYSQEKKQIAAFIQSMINENNEEIKVLDTAVKAVVEQRNAVAGYLNHLLKEEDALKLSIGQINRRIADERRELEECRAA